jgi:hypothetical protein
VSPGAAAPRFCPTCGTPVDGPARARCPACLGRRAGGGDKAHEAAADERATTVTPRTPPVRTRAARIRPRRNGAKAAFALTALGAAACVVAGAVRSAPLLVLVGLLTVACEVIVILLIRHRSADPGSPSAGAFRE